jgi:hypothetical protein
LCIVDNNGVGIWDIDACFNNSGADKDLKATMVKIAHNLL